MRKAFITSDNLFYILSQTQEQLGGTIKVTSREYRLEINNHNATGFISAICVQEGITYMEYNIIFKEDTSFIQRLNNSSSIYFGYCSKGNIVKTFGEYGKQNKLGQFQMGIFSNSTKKSTFLNFKKKDKVEFSTIIVDMSSLDNDELKNKLKDTFIQENNEFSYVGSFNLKILEKINYLYTISEKGLVRNLLINNTVNLILDKEIEKHKYDFIYIKNRLRSSTKANMKIIRNTSQNSKNFQEIPHSSKYLRTNSHFVTV